jgi:hypothetical protein
MTFHNEISPTTSTMGPSPNFQQYIHAPQMMNPYQQPTSMSYHESNSGAVRTPNRQSVNLLTTTDQIDNWMFSLNSGGAGAGAGAGAGLQDVFTMNTVGHHMNGMTAIGVKGKKSRPEVGYSRG